MTSEPQHIAIQPTPTEQAECLMLVGVEMAGDAVHRVLLQTQLKEVGMDMVTIASHAANEVEKLPCRERYWVAPSIIAERMPQHFINQRVALQRAQHIIKTGSIDGLEHV